MSPDLSIVAKCLGCGRVLRYQRIDRGMVLDADALRKDIAKRIDAHAATGCGGHASTTVGLARRERPSIGARFFRWLASGFAVLFARLRLLP